MNFDSNEGMQTRTWGPAYWFVLYTTATNYPMDPTTEQKKNNCAFVRYFWKVLPCSHCRNNFRDNIKNTSFCANTFQNRETYFSWGYEMHDTVNHALGKGHLPFSKQEARELYESFRASCTQDGTQGGTNGGTNGGTHSDTHSGENAENVENGCHRPEQGRIKCRGRYSIHPITQEEEDHDFEQGRLGKPRTTLNISPSCIHRTKSSSQQS